MSIRQVTDTAPDGDYRITIVRCDAPECRAYTALHYAESEGWVVAPHADRCPEHKGGGAT